MPGGDRSFLIFNKTHYIKECVRDIRIKEDTNNKRLVVCIFEQSLLKENG